MGRCEGAVVVWQRMVVDLWCSGGGWRARDDDGVGGCRLWGQRGGDDGDDDGCGGVVMAAVVWRGAAMMVMIMRVVLWWAAVGRQPKEGVARGGEWIWGSGRSGHEDNIWFRPKRSPENFSGGGDMVAGDGGWWSERRPVAG
ncbi:hypothetical protein Tco_0035809 [Tanacetum coccineum]